MTSCGKFVAVQAGMKTGNFPRLHFADVDMKVHEGQTCRQVRSVAGIPAQRDRMVNKFSGL